MKVGVSQLPKGASGASRETRSEGCLDRVVGTQEPMEGLALRFALNSEVDSCVDLRVRVDVQVGEDIAHDVVRHCSKVFSQDHLDLGTREHA